MRRASAFGTLGLGILIAFGAAMMPLPPAHAVDIVTSTNAPDLTAVRAKIKAKDFGGAIVDLKKISETVQHADVYNLLGFSFRKSGDYKTASTYYAKALDFDANHKGALEYQGELFVETGQLDKAKQNLARLSMLCPQGCEEREDLTLAIAAAEMATPRTN